MNILPLVLALVLMLSVITIERLERFKNQSIVQHEYQEFLKLMEREEFNKRQELLYLRTRTTHRQLSFRYILDKQLREKDATLSDQYRQIAIDLIKNLYQHADFYKEMEQKNPEFVEGLINAIQTAADNAPDKGIKRIEDIARLNLQNEELQNVFYHMLKGTITRDALVKRNSSEKVEERKFYNKTNGKEYLSLLTFIHFKRTPPEIQLAPRELLKAIFDSNAVVEEILIRRNELARNYTAESTNTFKNEFNPKRKVELSDQLLNFKISKTNKEKYN